MVLGSGQDYSMPTKSKEILRIIEFVGFAKGFEFREFLVYLQWIHAFIEDWIHPRKACPGLESFSFLFIIFIVKMFNSRHFVITLKLFGILKIAFWILANSEIMQYIASRNRLRVKNASEIN